MGLRGTHVTHFVSDPCRRVALNVLNLTVSLTNLEEIIPIATRLCYVHYSELTVSFNTVATAGLLLLLVEEITVDFTCDTENRCDTLMIN